MNPTSRRTVPVLLAIATLVPIASLGWLALRLIRQDREMEGQRRRERLEFAAGRVALAAENRLSVVEEQLAQGRGIRLTAQGLEPDGGAVVLFQPRPAGNAKTGDVFAVAEAMEFQRRDPVAASAEYRRLAQSPDPALRAAALVRLGRVLRMGSDREAALDAYRRLLALGPVAVDGQPAVMIARQARCRIYKEAGDEPHLKNEVAAFERALYSGTAPMDRATFGLYRDLVSELGGGPPPVDSLARTEAAIGLWQLWSAGELPAAGRKILRAGGQPVLALWSGGPIRPTAWFAATTDLDALLVPAAATQHLTACAYDLDGQRLFGTPPAGVNVILTPGETRLPFILRLAFPPGSEAEGLLAGRRTLLIGGLLFTLALMLAAAYGLLRATTKEMALARQQSDFISAVSHEFRTPITSMRHLTELLASNSVASEKRKAQYYGILARETERLHGMVESLLSFGRMQAGSYAWKIEPADAACLVRAAVEEFRQGPQAAGHEVTCEVEDSLPSIQADREALARAVSNLLDNAGKYSEPGTPIRVAARRTEGAVRISVEDHGVGIPADEQARLFQKFVRGSHARNAGIRGIGVGLALVKSVADAHGGAVLLASEPGRGSKFTLVIPCPES